MTDKELISYCRLHCQTPRALFSDTQINRMLKLAGYSHTVVGWHSVHEDMEYLCNKAEELMKPKCEVIPINKGRVEPL